MYYRNKIPKSFFGNRHFIYINNFRIDFESKQFIYTHSHYVNSIATTVF
jgi:hypothetical protein